MGYGTPAAIAQALANPDRNVVCLTGDGVAVGDQPGAKPVFDLDSVSLLRTIRTMRDAPATSPGPWTG